MLTGAFPVNFTKDWERVATISKSNPATLQRKVSSASNRPRPESAIDFSSFAGVALVAGKHTTVQNTAKITFAESKLISGNLKINY